MNKIKVYYGIRPGLPVTQKTVISLKIEW